ncbi:MAG: esterase family protein [Williamsia sp.]|nr:esterase family protein [Williamsia sp.]
MKKIFLFLFLAVAAKQIRAAETDTINVFSASMHKEVRCVVIKPGNYASSTKKYPVVYLLHGYGGNYSQWPKLAPQLKDEADGLQLILVCPDGGVGSWYLDSPVDTSFKYETFVSRELISYIDGHFRTQTDRHNRAITGLSMGGHGGLYLAIRHPDLYGAAGSTSGGVDIRPFPKNWDLAKRLGDTVCCKQNWEANTVINVVDNLHKGDLKLIIDCGTGDFFLQVNRNLHQKLLQMNIEHDYIERPGAHNSDYWKNSIDYQLLFFKKYFDGV